MRFTTDENQLKNLFDLCVGIAVFVIVVLTFTFNKSVPQQTRNQPVNLNNNQKIP